MKNIFTRGIATITLLLSTCFANAALITQDNSYTYFDAGNGLEWVYAAPCALDSNPNGSCNITPITFIDGFREATENEWFSSFIDLSALVEAFSSDTLSETEICATSFFGTGRTNCDFGDLRSGFVSGAPVGIAASIGNSENSAAEAFLVRDSAGNIPQPVNAPATLLMVGLGLVALRFSKKK